MMSESGWTVSRKRDSHYLLARCPMACSCRGWPADDERLAQLGTPRHVAQLFLEQVSLGCDAIVT